MPGGDRRRVLAMTQSRRLVPIGGASHLASAFQTIVEREGLTRRHGVMEDREAMGRAAEGLSTSDRS